MGFHKAASLGRYYLSFSLMTLLTKYLAKYIYLLMIQNYSELLITNATSYYFRLILTNSFPGVRRGFSRFTEIKCKVLHVGDGQPNDYVLRNENTSHVLDQVKSEKDIGVLFYSKLEFYIHITEKINKANGIFAMIRRS